MKIQGNAIRCRCASRERRAASHGEMNQNITIPPSDFICSYELKCARLGVVPNERAHYRSRICILIASPQDAAAVAQVQDFFRIFSPASLVSLARRVEIMQTAQHLLELAALVEHLDGKFQVLNVSVHSGRSARFELAPACRRIGTRVAGHDQPRHVVDHKGSRQRASAPYPP
jgi:hypothetical protein